MSNRDKEKVQARCSKCGRNFDLTYGRYRRFPKDHPWKCGDCILEQKRTVYSNLSDEEKLEYSRRKSEIAKRSWATATPEQYKRRCDCQKERWAKLSKEEIMRIMKNTHEGHKLYMQRPDVRAAVAERNSKWWRELSDEERAKEIKRRRQVGHDEWNRMTDEEKFIKMSKMWNALSNVGPTEFIFNSTLQDAGLLPTSDYIWGFNTYPYINPDYYKIFGRVNPVTGEENIPYHSWDFILFHKSDNPLLVDIDGSAHNPKLMKFRRFNCSYTEREKIDFNDSQRPYQIPDGMDAYVIEAHRDKLDDDVKVRSIKEGSIVLYKDFMKLILDRINPGDSIEFKNLS